MQKGVGRMRVGEALADYENRISQIEASLYYPSGLTPQVRLDKIEKTIDEISISTPWSAKQWDTMQQMKVVIPRLQRKLYELEQRLDELDEAKKHKKGKY